MSEVTTEAFNRYCAEVMRYTQNCDNGYWYEEGKYLRFVSDYSPYDDLNQASEVFDKLNSNGFDKNMQEFNMNVFVKALPIKESINKFITSTMGD